MSGQEHRHRHRERGAAGARFTIVFLVVAAILAVGLYGADAYAHRRVEREVATRLQSELGTPEPPVVEVVGRPFFTQVVGRKIGEVHVVADDVGQTNGAVLLIDHVDMTLRDLRTTDWWTTMTAASAEGTALVSFDALKQTSGVPLAYVGDGRFSLETSTKLYTLSVEAKVTGRLALDVDRQTVALADPKVEVAGYTLPDVVARSLIDSIVKPIPLEGIPFGLQVTSIDARDDGLHVGLGGTDIPIQR